MWIWEGLPPINASLDSVMHWAFPDVKWGKQQASVWLWGFRILTRELWVHSVSWIPNLGYHMSMVICGRWLGVPAVAQYSGGWFVFHEAHSAVLGIGFFGNPFSHYILLPDPQRCQALVYWPLGLPDAQYFRISTVVNVVKDVITAHVEVVLNRR